MKLAMYIFCIDLFVKIQPNEKVGIVNIYAITYLKYSLKIILWMSKLLKI